jgi:hypothetical protein
LWSLVEIFEFSNLRKQNARKGKAIRDCDKSGELREAGAKEEQAKASNLGAYRLRLVS